MNEENKHVFYDSTSVWLSVNCEEGKLTEFKVGVPVRIDSTRFVIVFPHLMQSGSHTLSVHRLPPDSSPTCQRPTIARRPKHWRTAKPRKRFEPPYRV